MDKSKIKNVLFVVSAAVLFVCVLVLSGAGAGDDKEPKIGDIGDGNRSQPVHVINLLTEAEEGEESSVIAPDDEPLMPFSPRQTCGECHDYEAISQGWHFNAADPCVEAGLPGEPWILVDLLTATQLPLSYRPWPGAFSPKEIGMTKTQFVRQFGRHLPGGGVAEAPDEDAEPSEIMRELVTGKLEINCMACHDGDPSYNQSDYDLQIKKDNLRWAATATCGFASVKGSAKDMPNTWDPFLGETPDDPKKIPPSVSYNINRFSAKNEVFLDIRKKTLSERCYFCHSSADMSHGADHWKADEDIHLKAGLTCVDCHRNGLNHAINRGYEGEPSGQNDVSISTLTCRGCHLGEEGSDHPTAGRLGAPMPIHKGIPTVHFEKLTCTACHSGPWPMEKVHHAKTSRAHALGTIGVNKSAEALPHISYPVFTEEKQPDGKIAPHKLLWPAFWGRLKDGKVTPVLPDVVKKTAGKVLPGIKENIQRLRAGNWPEYTTENIADVLKKLATSNKGDGAPVYISGGKLHRLDDAGSLIEEDHPTARPYVWSFAHDVRPASQSLGIDGAAGCDHCHNTKAPFFFGKVTVDSPVAAEHGRVEEMVDMQAGVDGNYIWAFNMSFIFRPWMKATVLMASMILAGFLLLFGLKGLGKLAKFTAGDN